MEEVVGDFLFQEKTLSVAVTEAEMAGLLGRGGGRLPFPGENSIGGSDTEAEMAGLLGKGGGRLPFPREDFIGGGDRG